jgi:L-2,4-diaminobutyrate transaminase
MMCAIEYVKDRATKEVFDAADGVGAKINAQALQRGFFSRARGDAYFVAPPIITENDTIDRIVEIMAESTKEVLG